MSRYLIEKLPDDKAPPADELRVRFTVDLPDLEHLRPAVNFALDWIQRHPDPPPTALSSAVNLIRNFLPPPKQP